MKSSATKRFLSSALVSMLALAWFPAPAWAASAPRLLSDVVAKADVIVVGNIVEVNFDQQRGSGFVLVLSDRVLKGGDITGPVRIDFDDLPLSIAGPQSLAGKRTLGFAAVDPVDGSMHLVPLYDGGPLVFERQFLASKIDRLVKLMADDPDDSVMQKVIKELATIHAYSDGSMNMAYLRPLIWTGSDYAESARTALQAIKDSDAARGVVRGRGSLQSLSEFEGLESLDQVLSRGGTGNDSSLARLERTYRSKDPRGVAILARWLNQQGSAEMRAAAAGALARIHTPDAVAILGPALNHADFQVQWRAAGGLAMFANNVPIAGGGPAPGDWPFRSDDTIRYSAYSEEYVTEHPELIDFWREWWAENASAVQALVDEAAR